MEQMKQMKQMKKREQMKQPECKNDANIVGNTEISKSLEGLLDIHTYEEIGYKPLFHCRDFRVARLNYHPELLVENIGNFQQHSLTDEAFILLNGSCILFLAEDETIEKVHAVSLEPFKVYNVKQGTYHTHTLSEDAKVLIVEAEDTCDDNSPMVLVNDAIRARIREALGEVLGKS